MGANRMPAVAGKKLLRALERAGFAISRTVGRTILCAMQMDARPQEPFTEIATSQSERLLAY